MRIYVFFNVPMVNAAAKMEMLDFEVAKKGSGPDDFNVVASGTNDCKLNNEGTQWRFETDSLEQDLILSKECRPFGRTWIFNSTIRTIELKTGVFDATRPCIARRNGNLVVQDCSNSRENADWDANDLEITESAPTTTTVDQLTRNGAACVVLSGGSAVTGCPENPPSELAAEGTDESSQGINVNGDEAGSSNTAAIAGGIVGGIILIAIVVLVVVCFNKGAKVAVLKKTMKKPFGALPYALAMTSSDTSYYTTKESSIATHIDVGPKKPTRRDSQDESFGSALLSNVRGDSSIKTQINIDIGGGQGSFGGLTLQMLQDFAIKRAKGEENDGLAGSYPKEGRAVTEAIKAISTLQEGSDFAYRYTMDSTKHVGSGAVVCFAERKFSKDAVAIKFFADKDAFERELEVHRKLSTQFISRLLDVVRSEASGGFPNALVFQRGQYTLDEWMKKTRPKPLEVKLALNQILEGLSDLHRHYVIHCDLQPSNIMWFSDDYSWKLTDLDSWGQAGEFASLTYSLLYACPEAVAADVSGKQQVALETSADMFSFGIIAFELATGMRFYGANASPAEVRECLLGFAKMPDLAAVKERQLQMLICNVLQKDPQARWTALTALGSAYFRSADDTLQQKEKFGMISEQLARIEQLAGLTVNEVQAANLMVTITISKSSRQNRGNFEIIAAEECLMMADDELPNQPVFLLNLECQYKLQAVVTHERSLVLKIESIDYIQMTPADGSCLKLYTEMTENQPDTAQAVALWDPAEHGAASLQRVTPVVGSLSKRLVPIDVAIVLRLHGQDLPAMLRGNMYLKMHRPDEKFTTRKVFNRAGKMWSEAPQWVRDAAKGTILLFNFGAQIAGL